MVYLDLLGDGDGVEPMEVPVTVMVPVPGRGAPVGACAAAGHGEQGEEPFPGAVGVRSGRR